jgi:LPXTG-motif cell wall-anchored protein
MDIGMYVAILVGSGLGLFLLIILGRRKKEEQEA